MLMLEALLEARIFAPLRLFGHELYVLSSSAAKHDEANHSVNPWDALNNSHDLMLFLVCALAIGGVLVLAAYLKRTAFFQKVGATLNKATVIAPDIIRVAFGASLISSALHLSLFGPELPMHDFLAPDLLRPIMFVSGVALIVGLGTRLFAMIAAAIWIMAVFYKGWYMLTYLNYIGEAIAVILLPVQTLSLDHLWYKLRHKAVPKPFYQKYSMSVTRIGFALALLYTAIAIKFAEAALALDVVNTFELTRYFPFDPLFIVLGAGLVEIVIAVLYLAGLLQRLTTIVFLVFLTLSLLFFKEEVWPHYLLIALGVGIFLHKPDVWALDKYWFNRKISSAKTTRRKTT